MGGRVVQIKPLGLEMLSIVGSLGDVWLMAANRDMKGGLVGAVCGGSKANATGTEY